MACLAASGYQGISLREAIAYRDTNRTWPEHAVVVTFDDGYMNVFESALPILRQYGFRATVFLLSDLMGGHNDWGPPPALLGAKPMLTWQQAAKLADAEIELGAHTRTHPDLRHLAPKQVEDEILTSQRTIATSLGQTVESFAYPFGALNQGVATIVAREFRAACTTVLKQVGHEPLHLLPRIDMYYVQSLSAFRCLIGGTLAPYIALRRWLRWARHERVGRYA